MQKYLDSMAELMIEKGLRSSEPDTEVRDIARARTLTVLQGLDGARKGTLLRFLKEAKLINRIAPIISLSTMHLDKAQLRWADLSGTSLHGAIFGGAELREAHLEGADLSNAYLGGEADLRGAYLNGADLNGAIFTGEDQSGADLDGAHLDGADLSGADLSGARNLKLDQICSARWGNEATKLPEGLPHPKKWSQAAGPPGAK